MMPLINAQGVSKSFGASQALVDFDFTLAQGEIHALLGENGAGKSTFIKILAGIHDMDSGSITVDGEPLGVRSRRHIAFLHQNLGLAEKMTVAENFGLVAGFFGRLGRVDMARLNRATAESLERVGVEVRPEAIVADLPLSQRSLVAIARSVHLNASILVLDEPTASLSGAEVDSLFRVLRRLREDGVGIIYVSHRLSEVRALVDRMTILRDGVAQATVRPVDVDERQLAQLIVGSELAHVQRTGRHFEHHADLALEMKDVRIGHLGPLNLEIRKGEVLSVTGLRGSGHEDIGRALIGMAPFTGEVIVQGLAYCPSSPRDALHARIAYVTGDRAVSVSPGLNVRENLLLNPRFSSLKKWIRNHGAERKRAMEATEVFGIWPPRPDTPIEALSGGNAQKVVLARSFDTDPQLVVLEEPTLGVDVGARADFYRMVREGCEDGRSFLLLSSDYDEIEAISDTVLILHEGRVSDQLENFEISGEEIARRVLEGKSHVVS